MSNSDTTQGLDLQTSQHDLANITAAFEACLEPRTSNDVRREALLFLEQVTSKPEAPHYGLLLARDLTRPQAIRYFGLQLLEFAIRYRFDNYDDDQVEQMLVSVIELASRCTDRDPSFYRNKIAQLWVECAERAWPDRWQNMDSALGRVWTQPGDGAQYASKILVADVIESLSADICGDDNVAALRIDDLGDALNEIVMPKELCEQKEKKRSKHRSPVLRWSDEGWLACLTRFTVDCGQQVRSSTNDVDNVRVRDCLLRALAALRSLVSWVDAQAVFATDVCTAASFALEDDSVEIQLSAIEIFRAVMNKSYGSATQKATILQHMLSMEQVAKFVSIFSAHNASISQQDQMSRLQRKASELLATVMDSIVTNADTAVSSTGFHDFLQLLPQVLQNDNLVISIPILHSWTKLLASQDLRLQEKAGDALGILMETCAQRLVNFDLLGEDFDHPIIQHLFQDFDTMPERHAFLANYRRYCVSVIEQVARRRPIEALEFVLGQVRSLVAQGPYTRSRGLPYGSYSKSLLPVQQIEAQVTVTLSVLAGLFKGKSNKTPEDDPNGLLSDQQWLEINTLLKDFCLEMCTVQLDDPEAQAGLTTLLSSIVRNSQALRSIVLEVTRSMLNAHVTVEGANSNFVESVKNFEAFRVVELQKIALIHADQLLEIYGDLERVVTSLTEQRNASSKVVSGYHAFLFIINQRSSKIAMEDRLSRLQHILQPLSSAWASPVIGHAVSSFESFCDMLGLQDLPKFWQDHNFSQVPNWADQHLNEQGQARLRLIKDRLDSLPLRMTRALLGATTEKLDPGSEMHEVACRLWASLIPIVLPSLLQMIAQAQAFSNMATWASLSEELQAVVRRTLQDRFWQSGISNESRDEFYARVSGSKSSYEGFASSVRGTIRGVREQGYQIIFLFTKFEEQFYGINDLPQPLADALFDDADSLSANHLTPLISLMTGLAQGCPPQHRLHFLPPLLRKMFTKLDSKIGRDWDATIRINEQSGDEDDLSEEMRIESVLRQVTYAAVSFVAFLFDFERSSKASRASPTLTDVVLSENTVLEPLMLFCTHALRMRDTRCCTTVCKILISILPQFSPDTDLASQVREFICTEVLKAGITSLNEQYFADMQRDLAALLAQIIVLYSPKTASPRAVLLSLPDMQPEKVDSTIAKLLKQQSARQQRALVLNLLESVRGVSIHDMGKVPRTEVKKESRNGVPAQYMEIEQKPAIVGGEEVGLDDMAALFGDG